MSWPAVALLTSAAAYAGFQWTIRILVYPQFVSVEPADFPRYEAQHQRLVSIVVGPLFAALVASTAAGVIAPPSRGPTWAIALSVVLVLVILGITGALAVPLHRRLSEGFDPEVHRRLLLIDSARLVAALIDTAVAVVLVARA